MDRSVKTTRKAPAGCLIPFGLIFLLIGLAVCWFAWTKILTRVSEVRKWTETPCRVTQWNTVIEPDGGDIYKAVPQIAYEFQANGKTLTGTTYDAALSTAPTLNELEEQGVAARAQPAVCYVNPANPSESTFRRASYTAGGFVLGFGLLFAGVGGMLMLSGVFGILRRVMGGAGSGMCPATPRGCAAGMGPPLFFGVFFLTGVLVWKLGIQGQPDWKTIGPRMVEVPAKILASGVSRHTGSGKNSSTSYKARVAWEYEFDGRTWHSGWLDFNRGTSSSSSRSTAETAANRYPAGSTARGWVDPQAPWRAVLEKESGARWWLWLFPLVFGGIGAIGLLVWLLKLTALGAALFSARRSADL